MALASLVATPKDIFGALVIITLGSQKIMSNIDIHINADLGEDYGRYKLVDLDELMPFLSACNIACGFHAGDPRTIDETIDKAKNHGLEIGAHPSYPDLQGFGRRSMDIDPSELSSIIRYQIAALAGMAKSKGVDLTHVKPHGALYNDAAKKQHVAEAVIDAVSSISRSIVLYVPPGSIVEAIATEQNVSIKREAFLDRTYEDNLTLTSRKLEGALIQDPKLAKAQVDLIISNQHIKTTSGKEIPFSPETYCIHGDNPAALEILRFIHA